MASEIVNKWLTGAEVMSQHNLRPFELLECLRMGLPVFDKDTLWPFYDDAQYWEIRRQLAHEIDIPFHRVDDYSELSPELAECVFLQEQVEEFARRHNLPRAEASTEQEIKAGTIPTGRYEDFVKSLRFTLESNTEVKIQEPGKAAKVYTCQSLGFRDENTKEWQTFRGILRNRPHTLELGPAHQESEGGRQRVKSYDSDKKLLEAINEKLVDFLNKTYHLGIPKTYRLYERDPAARRGTYKFIFPVQDEITATEQSGRQRRQEQDNLKINFKDLAKRCHEARNRGDNAEAEEIADKLAKAAQTAIDRGIMTEEEFHDLLPYNPEDEFKDIRYEPPPKSEKT